MTDYANLANTEVDKLLKGEIKDMYGKYIEEIICELLIWALHSNKKANEFFINILDDSELLELLFYILLDESEDYSNDARIAAAHYIGKFDEDLLKKHKDEILYALTYEIHALHPFVNQKRPSWLNEK
ncbi:hypothetical protein [Clostridium beijerinckii]|uniref:Immunity protein 30 domain-containing protein n=1 Tax=Clostridium beijerinckii TaxID=1520 RepID=A0AAX0B717_CLOBE|nr:hypothetical protein [Clostridium beijerinckii]NRT90892.1 hypothetical protein [Clostridium beijerinckii]NYC70418.1 hypothetical protein [Clostridium beijerinckii]